MADLITLAEYKALKGKIVANPNEDARITAIIPGVSQAIKDYIGRTLIDYYSADLTQFSRGDKAIIFLSEWPVVGTAVVSYKTSGNDYTDLTLDVDYYIDNDTGEIVSTDGNFFTSVRDPKFIKIVYKGGFAQTPSDIKMAAADFIEKVIKQEHTVQKTMGGQDSMTYPTAPIGRLPTHIAVILDKYRVPLY